MKIIAGLGNPGKEYQNTRHNVGFLCVDFIKSKLGDDKSYEFNKKMNAEISKLEADQFSLPVDLLLVKPQTYMNTSGSAVKKASIFYKVNPKTDLVVIHDDLDIEFGKWKIQKGKGPKQHNGINSIVSELKTEDFWRVRIGIAGENLKAIKNQGLPIADNFVLKPFSKDESQQLTEIFEVIYQELKKLFLNSS